MKYKALPTQEYLLECFTYDPETGLLYWKERPRKHFKTLRGYRTFNSQNSGTCAFTAKDKNYYFVGTLDGIRHLAHRIIWKLWYGTEPMNVLHSQGNTLDNRLAKLSVGTKQDNSLDLKLYCNNSSGIPGVCWEPSSNKWKCQIKGKHLGRFSDFFDACCCRKSAEVRYGFHADHGKR